jgi:RNA polymerase sigma factor for flagellar operon FliA
MAVSNTLNLREQLVEKYIPLVKYIASRVIIGKSKYIEYEDLVSYGMLGLMDAVNKFDYDRGMKFSTYASIRIKGSMIDEIRKNSPISKGAMDKLNRYNDSVEKLRNTLMREPRNIEIAEYLKVDMKELSVIENYINCISVISLEDILFSDNDDMPLIGTIEDKASPSPEKALEEKEEIEFLYKALERLEERDQILLDLYYKQGLTLKEIGVTLNVSESRVCQLHSRAIVHLRSQLKKLKY